MTETSAKRGSTETSRIIKAPRDEVYRACLDPEAIAIWRAPDTMRARMHAFDAREGGSYRMSLTYHDKAQSPGGKTSEDTDTFQGRFLELVPDEKIVELITFESDDPRFAGEMTITTHFADAGDNTQITMLFENIPSGVNPQDNETGTQQSLRKLAALLEA